MYAHSMLSFETAVSTTVNQTSLAVHEVGEGAPVVFVVGGVSDLRTWANQVEPIAEHYRTVIHS